MWRRARQQSANATGSTAFGRAARARTIRSFRRLPYSAFMSRKETGRAKSKTVCFFTGSLFVQESDRAGIEAVISADHLQLTGVNLGLQNRGGRTKRLHDILYVRFYCRLKIVFNCCFN